MLLILNDVCFVLLLLHVCWRILYPRCFVCNRMWINGMWIKNLKKKKKEIMDGQWVPKNTGKSNTTYLRHHVFERFHNFGALALLIIGKDTSDNNHSSQYDTQVQLKHPLQASQPQLMGERTFGAHTNVCWQNPNSNPQILKCTAEYDPVPVTSPSHPQNSII